MLILTKLFIWDIKGSYAMIVYTMGASGSLTLVCQGPLINILYIYVLNRNHFTNLYKTADLLF